MELRVESFAEAKYSRVAARDRPSSRLPEVLQRHRPISQIRLDGRKLSRSSKER